MTSQADNLQCW